MASVPCKVSLDLRQHQADQDSAERQVANFADEEDVRQVVVDDLVQPLADLFSTRAQIRLLQRSDAFKEVVNHAKAVEWLMRDLANLEQALLRRWENS